VRRRRPDSAEEEREYKKRKTREDPFLTAPQAGVGLAYDPAQWLRFDTGADYSRYLVQDKSGKVLGHVNLTLSLESNPQEGEFVHLIQTQDFAPNTRLQLWAHARTLKPRRLVLDHDVASETEPGHLVADYQYDRLTVLRTTGVMESSERSRMLPYSYDEHALPIIVRQLKFNKVEWPFEAALSQPEQGRSQALSIGRPERVDVLAADGVSYQCFELKLRCGSRDCTYWVQRTKPHRLVKVEDNGIVWTLSDFAQGAPR
jgi:hypothetical protein